MSIQLCRAEDIIDINKNKEYTLISTQILESVLTDTNLNAQTAKLWQILFNKARYNPNLEIKISYNYLAKVLNLSTRTIARYIFTLVTFGYLTIKHNFDSKGSQRPNTIAVRVPEVIIKQAKKKKDRFNRNNSNNNETLLNVDSSNFLNAAQAEQEIISVGLDENINSIQKIDVLRRIYNVNGTIANEIQQIANQSNTEELNKINNNQSDSIINKNSYPSQQANTTQNVFYIDQDNSDRGEYDINVIQINNNKKDINKNNNNVVIDSFSKNKIPPKESTTQSNVLRGTSEIIYPKESSELENQINLLYKQMLTGTWEEKTKIMANIKKLQEIITTQTVIANQKNQTEKTLVSNTNGIYNMHINPSTDFSQIKSDRELSISDLNRIENQVKKEISILNDQKRVYNEIIFAIRFGSLQKSKIGEYLTIPHAVSIALKLLREKRWETPSPLKIKPIIAYETKIDQENNRYKLPMRNMTSGTQPISHLLGSLTL